MNATANDSSASPTYPGMCSFPREAHKWHCQRDENAETSTKTSTSGDREPVSSQNESCGHHPSKHHNEISPSLTVFRFPDVL